ncbi:arylsulfatase [Actinopolymorpha sp. B11F2]|uniref:arylsulfatase n=1 Tax=Actinopolymorpha sp. B11F2 TaxID=3160862 RepID=UPI0032E3B119
MADQPNVVLICVDQWRGDCLSADGHELVHTPHLDALAARGARFRRGYSATPTCIPARAALMTGLSQRSHRRIGFENGRPWDYSTTMAGEFGRAGYQTQAIGKMHVYPERTRLGFDDVILHDGYLHYVRKRQRPYEEFDDYLPWLRMQAGASAVEDFCDNGVNSNSMVARPWDKPEAWHPTSWTVTQAMSWLYRRDPRSPFFLYLSFDRPHPPFDPPAWAYEQYLAEEPYHPVVGDWVEALEPYYQDWRHNPFAARMKPAVLHRARAGYYGHLAHLDLQINRFLEILGEFGLAEDTIVCFISDHGEMLGEHNLFQKGLPYEGAARIPFLLSGPGIEAGQVRDEIVELRDVMPTLLNAAGLKPPGTVEGRSVLPLLADPPAASWRDHLHGEHPHFQQTLHWIADDRWKYIWWSHSGQEQLFDLAADPKECHDLAADPACSSDMDRLRGLLVEQLRGREEGYVDAAGLVTGRAPRTWLDHG